MTPFAEKLLTFNKFVQVVCIFVVHIRTSTRGESEHPMPKSVFQGIYESIKKSIESGAFAYQSLLYSESEFCKQYGCSRSTVRRALAELAKDGYVQPIQGKGVRVIWQDESTADMGYSMGGLESFDMTAERMGFTSRTLVRVFEKRVVDQALSQLTGFPMGTEIFYISRVRYADERAVSIERSYCLASEAPGLTKKDVEHSLYAFIEARGVGIATGKRIITVERATDDDLTFFDIADFPAVGVMRGHHYDTNGTMFEFSEIRQRHDHFAVREVSTRPHA